MAPLQSIIGTRQDVFIEDVYSQDGRIIGRPNHPALQELAAKEAIERGRRECGGTKEEYAREKVMEALNKTTYEPTYKQAIFDAVFPKQSDFVDPEGKHVIPEKS